MKRTIQFCFSVLLSLSVLAQSTNQNYVLTRTYRHETGNTSRDGIQYYDGLGRPVQQVDRGAAPGNQDIVAHTEYDAIGRVSHGWLPAARASNNGNFVTLTNVKTAAWSMYADSAYMRPVYEPSPLNRVVEQYNPGRAWMTNRKSVKTEYLVNNSANTALNCRRYVATTNNSSRVVTLSSPGNYASATLHVTQVTDEDGAVSYTFTDKEGRTLLTRSMDGSTRYDTYYVYDEYGNLVYVLPPLAADALTATGTNWLVDSNVTLKNYAYIYRYDEYNRCTYKKLPGAEPVQVVYDKAHRPVLSQDGEQRAKGIWAFAIPDEFGRAVLTGTAVISSSDLSAIPTRQVKATYGSTSATLGYYTVSGVTLTTSLTLMSVNFYDNYSFLSKTEFSSLGYVAESGYNTGYGPVVTSSGTESYHGLLTGGMVRQFTASGTGAWLYNTAYYDRMGRMIQSQSTNHLGGTDKEYVSYNFSGQPLSRKKVHTASGKTTQTQVYTYTYDHVGRLSETKYKLNSGTEISLAKNTYDNVGRLIKVTRPATATMDYTYNVRSWLTGISSTAFNEKLYYNEAHTGSTPRYNGNISAVTWSLGGSNQAYNYTYDALSRLTKAQHYYNGSATYNYHTVQGISYDKHGNITALQRYGSTDSGISVSSFGIIDNLSMTYTGNQLTKVTDSGVGSTRANSREFKKYTTATTEYLFNNNGALTKDFNKGISEIAYNLVNLPAKVDIKNPQGESRNEYTYTASGVKLRTVHKWNPNFSPNPTIGSAVTVGNLTQSKTTDYVGNMIYENGTLKRINYEGGYYEPSTGRYYYHVTDHLGSVRAVTYGAGTVYEKSSYYPYGALMAGEGVFEDSQPYKFSGKEEDRERGLNLHDFHARQYEAALGRFTTMDPMAEKYYSWSPYGYCKGNPVNRVDFSGMDDYLLNTAGEFRRRPNSPESSTHTVYHVPLGYTFEKFDQNWKSVQIKDGKFLKTMAIREDRKPGEHYAATTNLEDATAFFEFATDKTSAEWKLDIYAEGETKTAVVGTSRMPGKVTTGNKWVGEKDLNVKGSKMIDIHSHPGRDGTKGGSKTDLEAAKKQPNTHNAVYHVDTKTMYQYDGLRMNKKSTLVDQMEGIYDYVMDILSQ